MKLKITLVILQLFFTHLIYGQSIEKDIALGKETNKAIISQIGLYEHPALINLNEVGQKLVHYLDPQKFDYEFGILDMNEPNAMALPGGYVYFSRGLLVLVNSEDELAGVMGHEITHVHDQHGRKAQNRSLFSSIFLIPGAIVGIFAPSAGSLLISPVFLFNSAYSRSNEKSADQKGAKLAYSAGYDPSGIAIILNKISEETLLESGNEEKSTWFDSHPYTPKRVEELNKYIPKLDYEKIPEGAVQHKAFLDHLEGIIIGDDPKTGIIRNGQFLHPDMGFVFSFPNDWIATNSPNSLSFSSPDKNSQLVFLLADSMTDPTMLANTFLDEFSRNYKIEPSRNEALTINGYPAHIIQFEKIYEDQKIVGKLLWLTRDGRTYQFVEIAEEKYSNALDECVQSFHTITIEERDSIYKTTVHIVQANEGETLEELSIRTGNSLTIEFTSLINNLAKDAILSDVNWVKIGVELKY